MSKKLNRAKPEGLAQPSIEVSQRWQDSWGVKITVTAATDSRITYVRDGYEHNCVCSKYRFRSEFSYLHDESEASQAAAKSSALGNVQDLRNKLKVATK